VSLGQWHRVVAERNLREGHLRVDQGPVEKKTSPGKAQGLNIHTPMYLGGVHQLDILPKPANITQMFKGCIGEVGGGMTRLGDPSKRERVYGYHKSF